MKIIVSVNSECISISNFTITKGIGRGYNVVSITTMNDTCKVGDELEIIINGTMHRFIIYSITFGNYKAITNNGRGKPSI